MQYLRILTSKCDFNKPIYVISSPTHKGLCLGQGAVDKPAIANVGTLANTQVDYLDLTPCNLPDAECEPDVRQAITFGFDDGGVGWTAAELVYSTLEAGDTALHVVASFENGADTGAGETELFTSLHEKTKRSGFLLKCISMHIKGGKSDQTFL